MLLSTSRKKFRYQKGHFSTFKAQKTQCCKISRTKDSLLPHANMDMDVDVDVDVDMDEDMDTDSGHEKWT